MESRRTTALEAIWRKQSIEFEDLADSSFRVAPPCSTDRPCRDHGN
jgi:hypothetical protein